MPCSVLHPVSRPVWAVCGLILGPTIIETVHFLELTENTDHVKNQVDQIPFDIISKYIQVQIIVLNKLQSCGAHFFKTKLMQISKSYQTRQKENGSLYWILGKNKFITWVVGSTIIALEGVSHRLLQSGLGVN